MDGEGESCLSLISRPNWIIRLWSLKFGEAFNWLFESGKFHVTMEVVKTFSCSLDDDKKLKKLHITTRLQFHRNYLMHLSKRELTLPSTLRIVARAPRVHFAISESSWEQFLPFSEASEAMKTFPNVPAELVSSSLTLLVINWVMKVVLEWESSSGYLVIRCYHLFAIKFGGARLHRPRNRLGQLDGALNFHNSRSIVKNSSARNEHDEKIK